MITSLKKIKIEYPWIANSHLYNEIIKDIKFDYDLTSEEEKLEFEEQIDEEFEYNVCDKKISDLNKLFDVIHYWGVYSIPIEILDTINGPDRCFVSDTLLDIVKNVEDTVFIRKFIRFISASVDEKSFCEKMAGYGYIDMLEWGILKLFPLNDRTTVMAINNGQFEMLKYLHAKNIPIHPESVSTAIIEGHLNIVKWMYDKNFAHRVDILVQMEEAFMSGNEKMVDFIFDEYQKTRALSVQMYRRLIAYRFRKPLLQGYKLLYKKGIFPDREILFEVILDTEIETLKWLCDEGYIVDIHMMNTAIKHGIVKSVEFLYSKGIIPNEQSFNLSLGYLKVMKFLYNIGCRPNENIIINIIREELETNIETIDFIKHKIENLIKLGYRKDEHAVELLLSKENGDDAIWLLNHDFPYTKSDVKTSIELDYVNVLKEFVKRGYELKSSDLDLALEFGPSECSEYLYSKGIEPSY